MRPGRVVGLAIAISALAACAHAKRPIWDLQVTVPAGWTRKNVEIGKTQAIELVSPGGDELHLYDSPHVEPTAEKYMAWKNHRYWHDEVRITILEQVNVADGWVASYELQTRIRPTPDHMIYSTRTFDGQSIDCVLDRPKSADATARAIEICRGYHF